MRKLLYILAFFPLSASAQSIHITASATTICSGTSVHFNASDSGVTFHYYHWKKNNVGVGTNSPTYATTALSNGDTIKCLLTNSAGDTVYATSNSVIMSVEYLNAGVIYGPGAVCVDSSITLIDPIAGGVWNTILGYATISSAGTVTGVTGGPENSPIYDSVYYTVTNSCGSTRAGFEIEIDLAPDAYFFLANAPYESIHSLCIGQTALVNLGQDFYGDIQSKYGHAGIVYYTDLAVQAYSAGIDTLYNIVTNACSSDTFYWPLTVIAPPPVPAPISPHTLDICIGDTIQMFDSTGGAWYASNPNASVGQATGIVTGLKTGIDTIGLHVSNQCGAYWALTTIIVDPPDIIFGQDSVCLGNSITLTDKYTGGLWSTGNPSIATIDQTGAITGLAEDTVLISYTLGSCMVSKKVTINPLPQPITGNAGICPGSIIALTENLSGGSWSNDNTAIATIDSFGTVKGINPGTILITYTSPLGCTTNTEVTVNPLPPTATGSTNICLGHSGHLYNAVTGGWWGSNDMNIATVDSVSGFISGINSGTTAITYTLPTGCSSATLIEVAYCYDEVAIYPNPSRSDVTIEVDTFLYREYAFVNSIGQVILKAPLAQTFNKIDVRLLPPGMYIIHLEGDNRTYVQKFVKE